MGRKSRKKRDKKQKRRVIISKARHLGFSSVLGSLQAAVILELVRDPGQYGAVVQLYDQERPQEGQEAGEHEVKANQAT